MQAFSVSTSPPNAFHNPSENDSYARVWDKYVADSLAEFGKRFGERLFALTSDLKMRGLADAQLDLDVSMMMTAPSGLPSDIPVRLTYIADHLEDEQERAILQLPLRRRLTPNDAKKLKAWLLHPTTGKLLIGYLEEEADSKGYAADFSKVFSSLGWTVVSDGPLNMPELRFSTVPSAATMGLTIIDVKTPPDLVSDRLMPALKEIGIVPNYYRKDHGELRTDVDVYFLVGTVPHAL